MLLFYFFQWQMQIVENNKWVVKTVRVDQSEAGKQLLWHHQRLCQQFATIIWNSGAIHFFSVASLFSVSNIQKLLHTHGSMFLKPYMV